MAYSRVVWGEVRASTIYLPAGVPCGKPSLFPTQMLWWHLGLRLPSSPGTAGRDTVVLIQRTHHDRYFMYHSSILAMLQEETTAYGLHVRVFGDRPLPKTQDTAGLFHRALLVVAPHGAGEANMIFSQPGTVLIEALCRPRPNLCFGALCQVLGFRYHGVYLPTKPCKEYTAQDLRAPVNFYLQHRHLL